MFILIADAFAFDAKQGPNTYMSSLIALDEISIGAGTCKSRFIYITVLNFFHNLDSNKENISAKRNLKLYTVLLNRR